MSRKILISVGLWLLLGVALLLVAAIALIEANTDAVRDAAARQLSGLAGRDVRIAGELEVAPSLTPTVTASGVTIANAPWGTSEAMLTADRLEVSIELLPLLRGDVRLGQIVVAGADVVVEQGPEGALNWQLGGGAPESKNQAEQRSGGIALDGLSLNDGRVAWRRDDGSTLFATIDRLTWRVDPENGGADLRMVGNIAGKQFSASGDVGTLEALTSAARPFPVDLGAEVGDATIKVEGQFAYPLQSQEMRIEVTAAGEDTAALETLLPASLPDLGSWHFEGVLAGGGASIQLTDVAGRIGDESGLLVEAAGGRIGELAEGGEISLPVTARAASLAQLGELFGIDLPALGPAEATAELVGSFASPGLQKIDAAIGRPEALRLNVGNGSIANVLSGEDLRLPFEIAGHDPTALVSALGWQEDLSALDQISGSGTMAGSIAAPALRDVRLRLVHGEATLELSGSVKNARDLAGLDASLSAEAPSLGLLWPGAGRLLPKTTPPFRASIDIGTEAEAVVLQDISASLGNTSVSGHLRVLRRGSQVPRIEGKLSAARVDIEELRTAFAGGGEAQAAEPDSAPGLSPDWMDALDAEIDLRADEVSAAARTFTNASAAILLEDGELAINDLSANLAGGTVTGEAELEPIGDAVAEVIVRLSVEDLEVSRLLAGDVPGRVKGSLDIDLNVNASGRTPDELLSQLEGDAALFAEEGSLTDVPLNRLVPDLDVTRILPFIGRRDSDVRVNCLIGEFDIDSGIAHTEAMLDTRRMTLLGEGTVALEEKMIDFSLRPVAKSRKLSTAEVPIDIEGSLTDPQVRPRVGATVGGAIRGILGGLLVPLNQLTALFGKEAKDACGQALRQARERARAERQPN